jgi:hypothetical protein
MIDWAASRVQPGAGVLLLRKFSAMADVLMSIGGSTATQAMLPKLGYRRYGELLSQARVVRPLRQFRSGYALDWKTPLRVLRNAAWSTTPLPHVPRGWAADAVTGFDEEISSIVERRNQARGSVRTVAGLNYFLSCPAGKFSGFQVSQRGRVRGYFILGQFQGQTRIIDLRIDSDDQDSVASVCITAARTAAALPQTCEIVAGFSCGQIQDAFSRMGFRVRRASPVFCYDPRKLMGPEQTLKLSMLDADLWFLANVDRPYLT